jgi:glycosyltransferase involved in cell wall biosynthesis
MSKIKILTGWSNKGGSTTAFIRLTNALNKHGLDVTLYGPHDYHLDKCKSDILNNFIAEPDDIVIVHFLRLPERPKVKKVILACHEKDLFKVGEIRQFWDVVVFLNERHREYHKSYTNKFTIIPNLKEVIPVKLRDEDGDYIAGIIGSFDENKQTHVSIQRALHDGCDKVYLFGDPNTEYFNSKIKPLLSDKVILKGFMESKEDMYSLIDCVYHSSLSEVACLVKDECEALDIPFNGNQATSTPVSQLSNDEVINLWVKLFES